MDSCIYLNWVGRFFGVVILWWLIIARRKSNQGNKKEDVFHNTRVRKRNITPMVATLEMT